MSADADVGTFEFALPSLGADMDRGSVTEWRVAVGDRVERGDVVAVVETEKSDIDVEIWHGGVVEEFLVEIGEEIEVGTPIARLRGAEGAAAAPATPPEASVASPLSPPPPQPPTTTTTTPPPPTPTPRSSPWRSAPSAGAAAASTAGPGVVPASPYARRLAAERGIDLGAVRGSGPGGAVVAADLERAPGPALSTGAAPPTSMRRLIAQRMATANREIPHYHLALDVDMTDTLAALADHNEQQPISGRILPAALYVKAVATALVRHPEFNGSWVDDAFVANGAVNVAMAISLRAGGLVTPHIERADELTLPATMERLTELVAAARTGNLKARWMTGASITITNLGDHGADLVHGVISPPQVALVGVGRTRLRPWVVDGRVEPRSITTLTLAADHRATDGMAGSRFLGRVADHLSTFPEDP